MLNISEQERGHMITFIYLFIRVSSDKKVWLPILLRAADTATSVAGETNFILFFLPVVVIQITDVCFIKIQECGKIIRVA